MDSFAGKTALVTGSSRGIGASVARLLAKQGADVVLTYRNKGARAEDVVQTIEALGRRALAVQADLTSPEEMEALAAHVRTEMGHLDFLILNASGGLEKDKPADYATALNVTAQIRAVDLLGPLLTSGGRIVFVTSHLAHFYGEKPVHGGYETVAASKKAGEDALRARIPEWANAGISFVVVSGDLIEGTITPKLLERASPGLIEHRRAEAGTLPTVEEFAAAIVTAAGDTQLASGATIFVGNTD